LQSVDVSLAVNLCINCSFFTFIINEHLYSCTGLPELQNQSSRPIII